MKRLALVFFVGVCLAGCLNQTPQPRDFDSRVEFAADFDAVWAATVQSLAQMRFELDILDKDSGLITIGWLDLRDTDDEDYCDCGETTLIGVGPRRGRYSVIVKSTAAGAAVEVITEFEHGFIQEGVFTRHGSCESLGTLEAELHDAVEANLES